MATSGSERNWKGMGIAALVISVVMGLILLAVLALTPPKEPGDPGRPFSFADFLRGNISAKAFNATWVSGKTIVGILSSSRQRRLIRRLIPSLSGSA